MERAGGDGTRGRGTEGTDPVVQVRRTPDGPAIHLVVDRPLVLGREAEDVVLSDPLLSARHLVVRPVGSRVEVDDLGSRNGSSVNGVPLSRPTVLRASDLVTLGNASLRWVPVTVRTERVATIPDIRRTGVGRVAGELEGDTDAVRGLRRLGTDWGGTLTFLFSDIEASTERAEAWGDQRWYEALTAHDDVVDSLVVDFGGRIVKKTGDGHLVTFAGATAAARCAVAIQQALARAGLARPELTVPVRMGLHTGEAIAADGDVFGTHVNIAARVANVAHGGQIVVSSLTREITRTSGDLTFGPSWEVELKGLQGTYRVSELVWR